VSKKTISFVEAVSGKDRALVVAVSFHLFDQNGIHGCIGGFVTEF
jgi:hypothetical protein